MKLQLTVSPVCNFDLTIEESLEVYSKIGFTNFEVHSISEARFLPDADIDRFLKVARRHSMKYTSFHLPRVTHANSSSLDEAIEAAGLAKRLGVGVVIYHAGSIDDYANTTSEFLDSIQKLDLTTVITNHNNSTISSVEDYENVLSRIGDDRLKCLLEVGHFHAAGYHWKQGYDFLKDRIGLVHIKDIQNGRSVAYGTGDVDFKELFTTLRQANYAGYIVFEMEMKAEENWNNLITTSAQHIMNLL